ncbi:MAG: CRTAC1 family protein [Planctomycetota bacterium]
MVMRKPCSVCYRFLIIVAFLTFASRARAQSDPVCDIKLTDVTDRTDIDFRHTDGGTGERYIIESVVAGVALFDYDGDGYVDIYFLNGAPEPGTSESAPPNALYRNNGDWTFTDVTSQAGVEDRGFGLGVTAGDFDNDGHQDLYLNNSGSNVLYRNNGDGTFTDVTNQAGVGNGNRVGAGTSFLDIEGDGDLDLYVANYVDFNYDNHIVRKIGPHHFHPGPADYNPVPDTLFRNNGDGTFSDVTQESGVGAVAGTGMGMVCFDFDSDGDTDVFVCNDHLPNFLLENDGQGHFKEVGLVAGVAFDGFGNENGSMGVDCGDYDNDGQLDLFMTNYSSELPVLYRNLGNGLFEDRTRPARIANETFPHVTWGTGMVDFDNDGHRDLFVACGHFMDNIRHIDDRTRVRVRNVLLLNRGDGTFTNVSDRCGNGLLPVEASKGAGFADLDNDGDVDVVILNANSTPTILRNDSSGSSRWLQIRLQGTTSSRDAVGAHVRVVTSGRSQLAEVHSGRGYQGHFGTRLHFGLGGADQVERVEVSWIGGGSTCVTDLKANQRLFIRQNGRVVSSFR